MQINIKTLRKYVKEVLAETYYGTSQLGSLTSPAFNKTGPSGKSSSEIPLDPVDIAEAVVVAIKNLISPVEDDDEAGARVNELHRCKKVLEGFGDEAINFAGEAAADALINTSQSEKNRTNTRLYEDKVE